MHDTHSVPSGNYRRGPGSTGSNSVSDAEDPMFDDPLVDNAGTGDSEAQILNSMNNQAYDETIRSQQARIQKLQFR